MVACNRPPSLGRSVALNVAFVAAVPHVNERVDELIAFGGNFAALRCAALRWACVASV